MWSKNEKNTFNCIWRDDRESFRCGAKVGMRLVFPARLWQVRVVTWEGEDALKGQGADPHKALAKSSFWQQKQGQAAHLAGEVSGDSERALDRLWDCLHSSGVGLGTQCGRVWGQPLEGGGCCPQPACCTGWISAVFAGHVEAVQPAVPAKGCLFISCNADLQ